MLKEFQYQASTVNYLCRDQTDLYHEINTADGPVEIQMASAKLGRGVVYAKMGLGKSRIAIDVCRRLIPDEYLLIICSRKALNTWRRELPKWELYKEDEITLVYGHATKRLAMWNNPTRVMAITYESAQRDLNLIMNFIHRYKVRMIIFDEAQKIRNRKTKSFILCKKLTQRSEFILFLSGTLITRGPQDLWTYLHMCDPKRFPSFWKFIAAFCIIVETAWGNEIVGPKNTKSLAQELSRCVIRLKDDDPEVKGARPPLTRDIIPIDPSPDQIRLHREFLEDMYITRSDGTILAAPSAQVAIIRMRQLMACPKIIDPALGLGANIEYILDVLQEDPHIVIFTPFRAAITFMAEAIKDADHPEPYILMGGCTPDDIRRVEEGFDNPKQLNRSCLCTTSFAESFELPSAKQCYFNGFDWSQLVNYQAEGRLQRLTTPHPINSYYLIGYGTVEEDVLHVLNNKQTNAVITMQDYINVLKLRLTNPRKV